MLASLTEKVDYRTVISRAQILDVLAGFDPHVAGTFPLELDVPGSDIDVLCHAVDADAFVRAIWNAFCEYPAFSMHQWTGGEHAVIASFAAFGIPVEIFGSAKKVRSQAGWKHFDIERRLLTLGGEGFVAAIREARQRGAKTEPAFAAALGLNGDPYKAMLFLADENDSQLVKRLASAGF